MKVVPPAQRTVNGLFLPKDSVNPVSSSSANNSFDTASAKEADSGDDSPVQDASPIIAIDGVDASHKGKLDNPDIQSPNKHSTSPQIYTSEMRWEWVMTLVREHFADYERFCLSGCRNAGHFPMDPQQYIQDPIVFAQIYDEAHSVVECSALDFAEWKEKVKNDLDVE